MPSHWTQKNANQNVARAARKQKLIEMREARTAEKKRNKSLTSVVRGVKTKRETRKLE